MTLKARTCLLLTLVGCWMVAWTRAFAQVPPPPPPPGTGGNGNWKIEVTYSGTVTTVGNSAPWVIGFQGQPLGINVIQNLSTYSNSPATTTSGGITARLDAMFGYGPTTTPNPSGSLYTTGGQVNLTLTWLPKNNNSVLDPAPAKVRVYWSTTAIVSSWAQALAPGLTAHSDVTISMGSLTKSQSADAAGGSVSNPTLEETSGWESATLGVTAGVATKSFAFSAGLHASGVDPTNALAISASASGSALTDFCVAGCDLSRLAYDFYPACGLPLTTLSGAMFVKHEDPSFTRWLPLSFSPQVTSQPFRATSGTLPAPWGNMTCAYSISLQQQSLTAGTSNPDVNSVGVYYQPSGSGGTYNSPTMPHYTHGNRTDSPPGYVITDANGDRLLFDASLNPFPGVFSNLVPKAGGKYELQNAGPPGALRQRGRYRYTFEPLSGSPASSRLLTMWDDIGNNQSLLWGAALVVQDSTNTRTLVFNRSGGYFTSVDAPASGSLPGTHTALSYDTAGHMTGLTVTQLGSPTVVYSEAYTYGGPNGDAILTVARGGSSATYGYAPSPAPDPFGLLIPRLTSSTFGSSTDTSSSDDGASVQGTFSATYGPIQMGYNCWGIDARTNTFTDALGNVATAILSFPYGVDGMLNGLKVTGPTYTGAASANLWSLAYVMNANAPTSATLTDPLNHVWQVSFDGQNHVTSAANPLGHTSSFTYGAGSELLTATDPTNLTWTFQYGQGGAPLSRLTSVLDPGNTVRMTALYNAYGQPTSVTVPAGVSASGVAETTTLDYHAGTGDLTKVTGPTGDSATINSYDALGDPLSWSVFPDTGNPATSSAPLTTILNYDASQAPITATSPYGTQGVATYSSGVVTQFQLANGGTLRSLSLSRDTRGRIHTVTDLAGTVSKFRYDKNGNVTRILDGKGNSTSLSYGPNGEKSGISWPGGGSQSAFYDAAGRINSTTDERGIVTTYGLDNGNRLTGVQFPGYPAQNVSFGKDAAGRTTSVTDSTGSTVYTYDPTRKRLTDVATTVGGMTKNVTYTYYADGKRASMTSPVGTTTYSYNAAGQLISLTNPFNETTTWTYDHAGRVTSEQTTGPVPAVTFLATFGWGGSGQAGDTSTAPAYLRTLTQKVNGATFWTYSLTHSYLGQLLQQQGAGSSASDNSAYSYDARGRLTSDANQYVLGGVTTTASGTYTYL